MDGWIGAALLVGVWWDGVPALCLLDTGAQVTVVRESLLRRIGTAGPPQGELSVELTNGAILRGTLRVIPNVGTRRMGWNRAPVLVIPDGQLREDAQECILGTNLLRESGAALEIDWARGEFGPSAP